jgi:hypothetical protein
MGWDLTMDEYLKLMCRCYHLDDDARLWFTVSLLLLLLTKKPLKQCLQVCIIILRAAQAAFVRALALYQPANPQHPCMADTHLIYTATSTAAAAAVYADNSRIYS